MQKPPLASCLWGYVYAAGKFISFYFGELENA
jgi:hypothetical protein